jgi:hypothetical protein
VTIFSSLYGERLHRELGTDDTAILFTTARRKQAINEAVAEFAQLTECAQRRATVALTGGTAEYDLNSTVVIPGGDFFAFSKEDVEVTYTDASSNVTRLSGDRLVRRDVHWLNRYEPDWRSATVASSVQQLPRYYYLRADGPALFLGFTPVPSTGSSASMTASVPYLAIPAALTSGTDEPFTFNSSVRADLRPYHQGLVHYAAAQLEKLRRDDQASDRQLQKFLGYVSRYLANLRVKGGRAIMQGRSYFRRRDAGDWTRSDPRT